MINFEKFITENILIDFPYSIMFVMFALLLCGFRDKLSFKTIFIFAVFQTISDSLITLALQQYGAQTIPYAITSAIFIAAIFKIGGLSSIVSSLISSIVGFITQLPIILGILGLLKVDVESFENNQILKVEISYFYFLLMAALIYLIYKKGFSILNLKEHNLFSKFWGKGKDEFADSLKFFIIALLPIMFFIASNYSIYYYQSSHNLKVSMSVYILVSSIVVFISSLLTIFLIRKVLDLKHYKLEWKTQQSYLNDINELLKVLKAQRHGFVNHINIINGLLTLKEYAEASDYILGINEAISPTNIVTLENPTMSALINAKAGAAESKKVKFEVKVDDDLSQLNFKAFEIGEAIGNIIDNAFDAACELPEDKRFVKVTISTIDNYYVFNIENTGKTIPQEITSKIFNQGFTTKDYDRGDHGFGLYITKTFIENYQGKIELESQDNHTSFKIFFPKVIQNEFKIS